MYNEILRDVAKKFDENESTNSIETSLLCKLIEEELKNSQDENTLRELVNIFELGISNINKQTVVMGLQSLIKIGGFKSYQIAVIVANQVMKVLLGRGLSLAANATLTRALSLFSGPVGWTIMTTWTALDLASPAYRVTIPAVLQIIILRLKHNTKN
ncbi:YaaW family protein [Campylobacter jejuni]|uniref:YaaW family protein n=1 Tax=Campylobacter jejuni TaxID=197 RepID=UPI0032C40C3A